MKIITLVENVSAHPHCGAAHGLSLWLETGERRLLMDAGPSALVADNARALGVDLSQAEMLVLSHGHYDHADGILAFAALNPAAPIYLRASAGGAYYSAPAGDEPPRYIGVDPAVLALAQLRWVDGCAELGDGLHLFGDVRGRRSWPESNLRLCRKEGEGYVQDAFDHEQCLAVFENGRSVLLSGCAHNGILNILDRFRELYGCLPDAVVSGFHMKKSTPYTPQEESTIRQTARELQKLPCRFYTCHCTGLPAYEMMKEIMGEQLHYAACGDELLL